MFRPASLTNALLPALLLSFSCQGTGPAGPDGVVLSVQTTPTVINKNERVSIAVTVSNPSTQEITLRFNSSCQLNFEIVDATTGAAVTTDLRICAANLTTMVLARGESRTQRFEYGWDGRKPSGPMLVYGTLFNHPGSRSQAVILDVRDSVS